jgi:L-iditol 2-dehydrogenase
MSKYKVGVMTAEKTVEIRELELKRPGAGQVLIKVDSCAICTMEQRVYKGLMKYYPFSGGHEMAAYTWAERARLRWRGPLMGTV